MATVNETTSSGATVQSTPGTVCLLQRVSTPASYAILLALGFFLFLYNLDGRLLWGDEAETAVLARNVTQFGYPKTFDGLNRISLYGPGIDSTSDVWVWSPWLQEYVAAGAFVVFGPTTWAARLPFALIGWACLPLLGWVAYRIYRNHGIALSGMALLATSEVFLLHARQCRYYSITVFTEILFIYSLNRCLTGDRRGRWLLLPSLVIQFYSNYLMVLANLPVLLVLSWNLFRRNRRSALWLTLNVGLLAVLATPWVIYSGMWRQGGTVSSSQYFAKLVRYLSEFNFHFAPLAVGFLPLAGWLITRPGAPSFFNRRFNSLTADGREVPLKDAVVPSFERHMLVLLATYTLMMTFAPGLNSRYLLPLLPVACLLTAAWIVRYIQWRLVAIGIIMALCLSNGVALITTYHWKGPNQLRCPLWDFVGGLTVPYRNRLADVVEYLNRETKPGQSVFVFDPEFPLIFYTRCHIIDARLAGGRLPDPLPDWVLSESASGLIEYQPFLLGYPLYPNYYEQITLPIHNSSRRGCLPEPDYYEYHCEAIGSYVIYKRKSSP